MATLVKISRITLYCGWGDTLEVLAECAKAKQLLEMNNIPFTTAWHTDLADHQATCKAFSTYAWGADFKTRELTSYPFLYWTEYYDDYERFLEVAHGVDEIAQCNVLKHKDLVS